MKAVIVMGPTKGGWPVIEVYVEAEEGVVGWGWQGGEVMPAEQEYPNLDEVMRHRNRWVTQAARVDVADEEQAQALLGKEYQGAKK